MMANYEGKKGNFRKFLDFLGSVSTLIQYALKRGL